MLAELNMAQVVFSMIWFFLFIIWIMLLFNVFADLFRSKDLGGFAKFLWVVALIVFPYLGVFIYLVVRGQKMAEHKAADIAASEEAFRSYVQDAAGSSPAAELERLSGLHDAGKLTDEEFASMKAKVLGG